ncbi:MAG TPA: hypothetical protein VHY84_06540 [Bryobacteraceae bacterium]|nr:hypothetical protein [Bryobacteraceae bacterium]
MSPAIVAVLLCPIEALRPGFGPAYCFRIIIKNGFPGMFERLQAARKRQERIDEDKTDEEIERDAFDPA